MGLRSRSFRTGPRWSSLPISQSSRCFPESCRLLPCQGLVDGSQETLQVTQVPGGQWHGGDLVRRPAHGVQRGLEVGEVRGHNGSLYKVMSASSAAAKSPRMSEILARIGVALV